MTDNTPKFIPLELYILKCTNSTNTKTYGAVAQTNNAQRVQRKFPLKPTIAELVNQIVDDIATIMPPPITYHSFSYKIPDRFPETLIYKGAVFDFEELNKEEKDEFRLCLRKGIEEAGISNFYKNS